MPFVVVSVVFASPPASKPTTRPRAPRRLRGQRSAPADSARPARSSLLQLPCPSSSPRPRAPRLRGPLLGQKATTLLPSSSLLRPPPRPRAPLRSRAVHRPGPPRQPHERSVSGGHSPCHCQSMGPLANGGDSLQDSFSRRAKSSAKPEAATAGSSGVRPWHALLWPRSCRSLCPIAVI
jgi:hypothetical protein